MVFVEPHFGVVVEVGGPLEVRVTSLLFNKLCPCPSWGRKPPPFGEREYEGTIVPSGLRKTLKATSQRFSSMFQIGIVFTLEHNRSLERSRMDQKNPKNSVPPVARTSNHSTVKQSHGETRGNEELLNADSPISIRGPNK